jgi:hypothetical protein
MQIIFEQFKASFLTFLKNYIHWVLLILGLIALTLGFVAFPSYPNMQSFLKTIGSTVLASGVFATLLKTYQYLGIFRDALREVIEYDPKYLEHRPDIENIWRKVSKALYLKKFPDISNEIENIVLKDYFPNQNYYHSKFIQSIKIQFVGDDNEYVELIEESTSTLKATSPDLTINFKHNMVIGKPQGDSKTCFELVEYNINNVDYSGSNNPYKINNCSTLQVSSEIELHGKLEYNIKRKTRKVYALSQNATKGYRTSQFVDGLEIFVVHPPSLEVEFFSMGTTKSFRNLPGGDAEGNIIRKEYAGLIFPKQGYRLIFNRR